MKKLVPILGLVIIGVILYQNFPGLRSKAKAAMDEYGGWTNEAIEDDPVGFIEHAEKQLTEDKARFAQMRTELAAKRKEVEALKTKTVEKIEFADAAASTFKGAYQAASGAGAWPVSLPADSMLTGNYTESQLKEQVKKLLAQKESLSKSLVTYKNILETAATKDNELSGQVTQIESQLADLGTKKLEIEMDQLTGKADEMMGKINDLIVNNGKLTESIGSGSPVRDLDELMKEAAQNVQAAEEPKAATVANQAVDEFLNG